MKTYLIPVWKALDPVYFKLSRLTYPSDEELPENIFRVRITKYKGRNVTLSDGTTINKNDLLIKIHLHNIRLLSEIKDIKSEVTRGRIIFQYVKQSLPILENYINNHKKNSEIKGIIGISMLNRGCQRLGFDVIGISHPLYRRFKRISCLMINLLSHSHSSKSSSPSYLFMSKEKLSIMYNKESC
nr:hypothetical protein [Sediminibacillus massiliensis]